MRPSRDLHRHIGQLMIAGFDGQSVPIELAALAGEFDLAGVILFARNIDRPEQVADLAREVQSLASDLPLWVSVDQEGGRVARLRAPFTEWPPMATLGRSGDEQLTRRFARALAAELDAVGITLDYAPVLDVHSNLRNPVIGDRALSDDPHTVAKLGRIIIETLQENGIAACGKHFPGHGDTSVDSHHELPIVEHPPERLRDVELVPFRAAVEAGVASIMTAHVLIPSLDDQAPATLSRRVVGDVLRGELGYNGLILSDDLDMRAIADRFAAPEAAVRAIAAGCDTVLVCGAAYQTQAQVLERLIHALERDELPPRRVEDAMSRQRHAKERFLSGHTPARTSRDLRAVVGRAEHQAVADALAAFL
ncbi:MAG: beta-N-acetylhexosaminidase [Acidobacteria bacterium]|nr:beta-N-acetylhexosaminidase [Acidobacteriota bacterium]